METTEKINIAKFKAEIKSLANGQKDLKNQRKTDKIVGERYMSAKDAAWDHKLNREILSAMYVAYGVMRGKDLEEQIKSHVSKKDDWTAASVRKKAEKMIAEFQMEEVSV